jgi:phage-related holin
VVVVPVGKLQVVMVVLAVVLVVEMVMQTVPEVAMHHQLVKVMMVATVEAVELTLFVAVAVAVLLAQLVAIVGIAAADHILGAVTAAMV